MVLYHAVSSYQLLEVTLHRLVRHPREEAALILPDFIREKYPWYRKLKTRGFFQEVKLFPYLEIPHTQEEEIFRQVRRRVLELFPRGLRGFSEIYVAGSHFYFSLYLIEERLPFTMFEDAAGMLSRPEALYRPLLGRYPLHARIAQKYGLFDGSCPQIGRIICLKKAQKKGAMALQEGNLSEKALEDFSVEKALGKLPCRQRKKLVGLFVSRRIWTRADTILLTQQLARLGIGSLQGQREAYRRLWEQHLKGRRVLVKPHPDDTLDYRQLLPGCRILRQVFPAELLPYVFYRRPRRVCTFDSTSCANLEEHFQIERIGRSFYESSQESGDCQFRLSAADGGAYAQEPSGGNPLGFGGDGRNP